MTLFGVTTLKQTEWYQARTEMFRTDRHFSKVRKDFNRDAEKAFSMLEDPKTRDRGIEMIDELHGKITLSGLSFTKQTELRRAISRRLEDEWVNLQEKLMDQERYIDEQRLGKVLGRFN